MASDCVRPVDSSVRNALSASSSSRTDIALATSQLYHDMYDNGSRTPAHPDTCRDMGGGPNQRSALSAPFAAHPVGPSTMSHPQRASQPAIIGGSVEAGVTRDPGMPLTYPFTGGEWQSGGDIWG